MEKASGGKRVSINEVHDNQDRHEKELRPLQEPPSKIGPQKTTFISEFIPILIVLVASFAVYFNALSNGFVYDDLETVLKNPWLRDIKYIPKMFSSNLWGFMGQNSNYYRPVASVFGILLFKICGTNPYGYHLFNVLVHSGVSVIVLLISWRLIAGPPSSGPVSFLSPALIAALLFAVHPIHTEAVAWSGGFSETSFAFFYLLSLYFYIRSRDGQERGYLLSVFLFSVSAFCKETALTLPVLIVVYDDAFQRAEGVTFARIKRYFPYFAVTGAYLIARFLVLGGFAPLKEHAKLTIYQQLINVPPLFARYLEKMVFPLNLNVSYVFHPIKSLLELESIIALFCTAIFVFLAFTAWRKNKTVFFSLVLLIVPLLPAFYIRGFGSTVFAERYLYLPSFGFVLLPAILTSRVLNKSASREVGAAVLIIILCLFSYGTIQRNVVWKNNYTLWSDTVEKSPDSVVAHNNLGSAYNSQGQLDKAIAEFRRALKLNPDYVDAYYNLGVVYAAQGQLDKAIAEYQTALWLKPDYPEAHYNLGNAYASQGQLDKAIAEYQTALWLKPDYPEAHNNLGIAYKSQGQLDKAIAEYQTAILLKPDYPEAHNNLGIAYAAQGQLDKAIAEFQTAIRLKPDYAVAHNNLGGAYSSQGQLDKAIAEIQTALRLKPDYYDARQRLNDIISKQP